MTNVIEGFNRQLHKGVGGADKVTKSKTAFLSDNSLLKRFYLAAVDITKQWTGQNWKAEG